MATDPVITEQVGDDPSTAGLMACEIDLCAGVFARIIDNRCRDLYGERSGTASNIAKLPATEIGAKSFSRSNRDC
jgi:hypothetical protein